MPRTYSRPIYKVLYQRVRMLLPVDLSVRDEEWGAD